MFKELFESKKSETIIYDNMGTSGTSLCKRLSWDDQGLLSNAIKSNKEFNKIEGWFEDAIDSDQKYSYPIVIQYKGKKLSLYGANGKWRIGGNAPTGGKEGFYNCNEISNIKISDLAKELKKAKIK